MAKPNVVSKEELLEAAKKCLVDRGMQRFTLRAVAETGGVTQGTVYYHFRTKEQLLVDIAEDVCSQSWEEIDMQQTEESSIEHALAAAKSRCTSDSFYHKLILSLIVIGFDQEAVAEQMGAIFDYENKTLTTNIKEYWKASPVEGVSMETWGIILNAMIDGLAMQMLQNKNIVIDDIYEEIEVFIKELSNLAKKRERPKGFGMLKRNSLFY